MHQSYCYSFIVNLKSSEYQNIEFLISFSGKWFYGFLNSIYSLSFELFSMLFISIKFIDLAFWRLLDLIFSYSSCYYFILFFFNWTFFKFSYLICFYKFFKYSVSIFFGFFYYSCFFSIAILSFLHSHCLEPISMLRWLLIACLCFDNCFAGYLTFEF